MDEFKQEKGKINKLLDDVLMISDDEDSISEKSELTDEKILDALAGIKPFSIQEQKILINSYLHRQRLMLIASVERTKAFQSWKEHGCSLRSESLLAAADSEESVIQPLHYKKEFYEIYLIPIDAQGKQWRIEITISDELKIMTPCGFKLVDDGGREWISGQPNDDNELIGFWVSDDSLLERIKKYNLPVLMPL